MNSFFWMFYDVFIMWLDWARVFGGGFSVDLRR